jgi:hypothetical protein
MVLSKDELMGMLEHEVKILVHLTSKVEESMLEYRPTPKQRSLRQLLEYLSVFMPVVVRTIRAGVLDMDAWRVAWGAEEAAAKAKSLAEIRETIACQPDLFEEIIRPMTDEELRTEMDMFGRKASRGGFLVWMLLSHYAAYRMQLFLYLKAAGREEIGTMDLWAGVDGKVSPVPVSA